MKKTIITLLLAFTMSQISLAQSVMTKKADGTTVINTTTLAKDVTGYQSPTPLQIEIQKGKITKVTALRNTETPKYFARIKKLLLPQWEGMKVSKALKTDVDGVTGATLSSKAVKENMKRGLEYYKKH